MPSEPPDVTDVPDDVHPEHIPCWERLDRADKRHAATQQQLVALGFRIKALEFNVARLRLGFSPDD